MSFPDVQHYWNRRDASSDPDAFAAAFIGALSVLVSPEVWELAIEAAQDTDKREAMKRAAAS